MTKIQNLSMNLKKEQPNDSVIGFLDFGAWNLNLNFFMFLRL